MQEFSEPLKVNKEKPKIEGSNYLIKHWRGELPLWKSFWINGMLLNFICLQLTTIIPLADLSDFGKSYIIDLIAIISLWIGALLVNTWQIVGIWRSAMAMITFWGKWEGLALIVVFLWALQLFLLMTKFAFPQINELWKLANNDPIAKHEIRILRDATEMELSGYIGFGVTEEVQKYLEAQPSVRIIHLNSRGGRLSEARQLANLIERNNLTTYTATECYNACIFAYAAGKERLIAKDAIIRFYQYKFPGISQSASEYEIDKRNLILHGIKPEFVAEIFVRPDIYLKGGRRGPKFWEPSYEELYNSGFVTRLADDNSVAISGITLSKLEQSFLNVPIIEAISKYDPEVYKQFIYTYQMAIEKGYSTYELSSIITQLIQKVEALKRPHASSRVLMDSITLYIEELTALKNLDPIQCYNVLTGIPINNLSQILSVELEKKHIDIGVEIIKSYSLQTPIPYEREISPYLEKVFIALRNMYGDKVAILANEKIYTQEEKSTYCTVTISLYQLIKSLPEEQAVPIFRYVFANAKK